MELRWYQQEAIDAVYDFLRNRSGNPLAVLPTGAGKTPVIAHVCRDAVLTWDGRVLVVAHVKELLEQSADKLRAVCPAVPVGLYSAGLGRRDTAQPVIVAGVQSVYDKADRLGRFDLLIVDECHLIPDSGDGMYRQLIAGLEQVNPDLRVIGLTATPYRLGSGLICGPDRVLTDVCYEVGVKPLIAQGYLSPLVGKAAVAQVDPAAIKVVRGEYEDAAAEAAFTAGDEVPRAVREVVAMTADRRATLLFCQTVGHARQVAAALRAELVGREAAALAECDPARAVFEDVGPDPLAAWQVGVWADWLEENGHPVAALRDWLARGRAVVGEVYGDTPADERAALLAGFKAGAVRYLVNVNVLTTGFDAPNVDCVCLLRATASPGLYYQMVGRGFRLAEGKANCLVLDFGTNIERHGPVDCVKPAAARKAGAGGPTEPGGRVCPQCRTVGPAGAAACVECGLVWEVVRGPAHGGRAADAEPVSGGVRSEAADVLAVTYKVHTKKGAGPDAPKTLRVTYQTGAAEWVSEWVCLEHPAGGFARRKAEQWWKARCRFPFPVSTAEGWLVAQHGLLAPPLRVTVKTDPKKDFPEVVKVECAEKPRRPDPCPECGCRNARAFKADPTYPGMPPQMACICGETFGTVPPEVAAVCHPGGYNGLLPQTWFDDGDAPDDGEPAKSLYDVIADLDPDYAGEVGRPDRGYTIPDDIPF